MSFWRNFNILEYKDNNKKNISKWGVKHVK